MSAQGEQAEYDEDADTPQEVAEARRSGWRPLDEYTRKGGDPNQWRSAREFLARGDKILPVVRAERDRLREQVERLEGDVGRLTSETSRLTNTIEEQRSVLSELREMARTASDAGYQRAMAELTEKRREAVQAGDVEAVDQISEQIEATRAARIKPPAAKEPSPNPQPQVKIDPAVDAFVTANPWFMQDRELHDAMNSEHTRLLQAHPAMPIADNLVRAKQAVMAKFPAKFGIEIEPQDLEDGEVYEDDEPVSPPPPRPRARSNAPMAPTSPAPRRRTRSTGIESIEDPRDRAEAQAAFRRLKEQMPDYTEDEYMAVWRDPHADILTMKIAKEKR